MDIDFIICKWIILTVRTQSFLFYVDLIKTLMSPDKWIISSLRHPYADQHTTKWTIAEHGSFFATHPWSINLNLTVNDRNFTSSKTDEAYVLKRVKWTYSKTGVAVSISSMKHACCAMLPTENIPSLPSIRYLFIA